MAVELAEAEPTYPGAKRQRKWNVSVMEADIPDIPLKKVSVEEKEIIMKERRRVKEKLREQNRSCKRTGVDQKRPTTADESARRAGQCAATKPVVITNASEA